MDFDNMGWTSLDDTGANQENTLLQSPFNDTFVADPFQASNVRHSVDETAVNGVAQESGQALDAPANFSTPKQEETATADTLLPPLPFDASMDTNNLDSVPMSQDPERFYFDDDFSQPNLGQEPSQANSEPEKPDIAEMNGFAQLSFQDGEFLVTTTQIILGRDDKFARKYHQEQKLAKRRFKEGSRQAREVEAQEALHQYQQEPSQPSAHGEEPSPIDSSLEGRPARGLASAYSEQGGIVGLPEDENRRRKKNKKRRNLLFSGQSSSTTSVAPANLHAFKYDISPGLEDDTEDVQKPVFLPVHPNNPADIKLISREHLHIGYNNQNSRWEMRILGRSAYVKNELYYVEVEGADNWEDCEPKLLERDEVAVLTQSTEIIVASLRLQFKLPRNKVVSTFDSDSELSDALSSPEHQLSTAQGGAGSDLDSSDEDDVPLQSVKQKKSKKKQSKEDKAKSGQKPVTLKLKKRKDSETSPSKAPPETPSKAEKGKKPKKVVAAGSEAQAQPETQEKKEAPKQPMTLHLPPTPTQAQVQEQATPQAQTQQQVQTQPQIDPQLQQPFESIPPETPASATPGAMYAPQNPSEPVHFEPGSMLSDVPMDQLPEKRKGPGRPPKNGLISKRDMGIIRRKQKEFEKQGIPVPPLDELVRIVRTENKAKEAAAKAAARGEAPPPAMAQSFPVMQSIEVSQEPSASQGPTYVPAVPTPVHTTMREGEYASADAEAKGSPKRPRTYRSPSPMKSKEECTEEELKKPNHTYYTTLDEILSEGPPEGLELQQIYDKICKKYPYYKYGVDGHGWQSSVRHNLKQHERFQQVTKQGKGWLWAINQEIPFDKEKKRKPTPPPIQRPPMGYPMANGMPPQPGMQQYGNPYAYGQPMPNGQPQYQQPPAPPGQQYASPFGQGGQQQYAQPGAPQQYMPPGTQPPANPQYPYQPQQQQQPPPPPHYPSNGAPQQPMPPRTTPTGQRQGSGTPHPQPGFSNLVDEIMAYRSNHLRPYAHLQQTPLYKEQEDVFKKCVEWISELQSNRTPQLNFANDQERRVFTDLERIMKKYQNNPPAPAPAPAPNAQQPAPTSTAGVQAPPAPQQPPAAPGSAPPNAPTGAPANAPVTVHTTASMGTPTAPPATAGTSTADTAGIKRPAPEGDNGDGTDGGEAKRVKVEGDGINAVSTTMPATQMTTATAGPPAPQQHPQTAQMSNPAPSDNTAPQAGAHSNDHLFDFSNPSGPQDPVFDFSTPDHPGAQSSQPVFDFSDPTPAESVPATAPVEQQSQPYNPPAPAQGPQPPQQQFSQPPQNPGTPQAPQPSPLYSQPPSHVASAAPTPQPTQAYSQPPSQHPSAAPTPQPHQAYSQPPSEPPRAAPTPQPTQHWQPPLQPQSHVATPQPIQHYQPPSQPHSAASTPRPVQYHQPPPQPQSGMATPQHVQQPSSHQATPSHTPGPGPAASGTPLSIEDAVETMLPVATSGYNTPTGSGTGANNTPAPQS